MGKTRIDLTERVFGKLTCVKHINKSKNGSLLWLCLCLCGNEKIVTSASLVSGNVKSCGCLNRESLIKRNTVHSLSLDETGKKPRLYNIWKRMRQRCFDRNASDFKDYGGRGITICSEWSAYKIFHDWALENNYRENLTIERKNVNGNYEPSNCEWITFRDQGRNRRSNRIITFNGKSKPLVEWGEILNIEPSLLRYRLRVWGDVEKAFTTPVKKNNN